MRHLTLLASLLIVFIGGSSFVVDGAMANVPPPLTDPDPQPLPLQYGENGLSEPAKFIVQNEPSARYSRIIIPEKYIVPLNAAKPAREKTGLITPTRSIVAGLAMSAAVAAVFLTKRRGRAKAAIAVVAVGMFALGAAAPAIAEFARPVEERVPHVIIELVAEGDQVIVIQGSDFSRDR